MSNSPSDWLSNKSLNPFAVWLMPQMESTNELNAKETAEELKMQLQTSAEIGQSVLSQYRQLSKEHQKLQADMDTFKQQAQSRIEEFEEERDETRRVALFWRNRTEQLQNEYVKAEETIHTLQIEIAELKSVQSRVPSASAANAHGSKADRERDLEMELQKSRENEWALERKLQKLQSRIDELENESIAIRTKYASEQEVEKLRSDRERLAKQADYDADVIIKLQKENESLKKQLQESDSLVEIVKEMQDVNMKTATELDEAKRLLNESREELQDIRNRSLMDHSDPVDINDAVSPHAEALFNTPGRMSLFGELATTIEASVKNSYKTRSATPTTPLPASKKDLSLKKLPSSSRLNEQIFAADTSFTDNSTVSTGSLAKPQRTLSDPAEHSPASLSGQVKMLASLISHALQRISSTNTLALNRRLRKTFDLPSLSQISNSILEHIQKDVENYGENFPANSLLLSEPFGILYSVTCSILQEIISLRKRINEIETAYFLKMDEISKTELNSRLKQRYSPQNSPTSLRRSLTSAGAWLRSRNNTSDPQITSSSSASSNAPSDLQTKKDSCQMQ
jgi:hypothetical protein